MEKIDIVVTWVDGTDPKWLKEKSKYVAEKSYSEADSKNRYSPSDLFKYWFRGIENNMPWINKVFFITYGHIPGWLNKNHPKLKIIRHADYIPNEYLPTYNSNIIELHLHRIRELSEKFILFNDDVYAVGKLEKRDFFVGDRVRDLAIYKPIVPYGSFSHTQINNTIIMNKYFSDKKEIKKNPLKFFRFGNGKHNINNLVALLYPGIIGYMASHIAQPHLKSTFKKVFELEKDILPEAEKSRFRTEKDISHYLMSHWNIETGKFLPRDSNFGRFFLNSELEDIKLALKNKKYKIICINDDLEMDARKSDKELEESFSKLFPNKSEFEL